MGTRSIYRELGQHHAPLVRPLGEASRRAEPEPASGRASKLWLPTARVVDIGYCGYSEPFCGAGDGHTGFLWTSPDPDVGTELENPNVKIRS